MLHVIYAANAEGYSVQVVNGSEIIHEYNAGNHAKASDTTVATNSPNALSEEELLEHLLCCGLCHILNAINVNPAIRAIVMIIWRKIRETGKRTICERIAGIVPKTQISPCSHL